MCRVPTKVWQATAAKRISRENQGLETRMMLGACFKPCWEHALSNAQASRLTLGGWCALPIASMSRSCAAAAAAEVGGHRSNP
jgi:hypothetical protein